MSTIRWWLAILKHFQFLVQQPTTLRRFLVWLQNPPQPLECPISALVPMPRSTVLPVQALVPVVFAVPRLSATMLAMRQSHSLKVLQSIRRLLHKRMPYQFRMELASRSVFLIFKYNFFIFRNTRIWRCATTRSIDSFKSRTKLFQASKRSAISTSQSRC